MKQTDLQRRVAGVKLSRLQDDLEEIASQAGIDVSKAQRALDQVYLELMPLGGTSATD